MIGDRRHRKRREEEEQLASARRSPFQGISSLRCRKLEHRRGRRLQTLQARGAVKANVEIGLLG